MNDNKPSSYLALVLLFSLLLMALPSDAQKESSTKQISSEELIQKLKDNKLIGLFDEPTVSIFRDQCTTGQAPLKNPRNAKDLCEIVIKSDTCKSIPAEKLIDCNSFQKSTEFDPWDFITGCTSGVFESASDILSFIWDVLKWVWNSAVDPKGRLQEAEEYAQSIKLFLATEYERAYSESSPPMQAAKAAGKMSATIGRLLLQSIQEALVAGYKTTGCLNFESRTELMCKLVGDFLIPPAGAFAVLKYGPKALKDSLTLKSLNDEARPKSRGELAENVLKRGLTPAQQDAIEKAHRVGEGEKGRDGKPAQLGNYTQAHLKKKAEILRAAGIDRAQTRSLMENGVVGLSTNEVEISQNLLKDIFKDRSGGDLRFPLTGDNRYDRFRMAFNSGKFAEDERYVSVPFGNDRVAARVLGRVGDQIKVELTDASNKTRTYFLSEKEALNIRVSDSARMHFFELEKFRSGETFQVRSKNGNLYAGIADSIDIERGTISIRDPKTKEIKELKIDRLNLDSWQRNPKGPFSPPLNTQVTSVPKEKLNPNYQITSRRVSDYKSRQGEVVEVNYDSLHLKSVVGDAVSIIEKETGLRPGVHQNLDDYDRFKIQRTWLHQIAPRLEDPDFENYSYARDRLIEAGGGRADLGKIASESGSTCRELSMCASIILAEYGIPSKVVTGNVATGAHAWLQVYDKKGTPLEVIDSNYTRKVHSHFENYRQQMDARVIRETEIVQP